jgi:hypothetical protein
MTSYAEQVQDLELMRDAVREAGKRNGWDPSCERASSWHEGRMEGAQFNRVWAALNQAARSISQLEATNEQLRRRNDNLASGNAALMNDRSRGIEEANVRAHVANAWASGVAKRIGMTEAEWTEAARDQHASQISTLARLEREAERLETLRTSVVVPLIGDCGRATDGFTAKQVKQLKAQLERANKRAMGRLD